MTTAAAWLQAREQARTQRVRRLGVATLLLATVLVLVWLISLSRSLFYPLGQDQAFFRYVTEMMRAGRGASVAVHLKYNPVFTVIQWLSLVLFGSSELGFHAFDACWQLLTMAALITLAGRDGRQWQVGLAAATLYVMAYYGLNYQVINGRDVCAVLPLLLMAHALVPIQAGARAGTRPAPRCFLAGVMGFVAYMLKLPLGLGFGLLWLYVLAESVCDNQFQSRAREEAVLPDSRRPLPHGRGSDGKHASHTRSKTWSRQRQGLSAFAGIAGLTAGFVLSALAMGFILLRVGWWDDLSPLFTNYQPKAYTTGHWMMLELAPRVVFGSAVVAAVLVGAGLLSARAGGSSGLSRWVPVDLLGLLVGGALVFGLLVTIRSWPGWRNVLLSVGGLLLPGLGAVLICPWRGRSATWRMSLLLTGAGLGSVFLQGKFWYYHFVPLLAFGSYLTADELVRLLRAFNSNSPGLRAWTMVCVAAVVFLGLTTWWPRMAAQTTAPNVLAHTTLEEHHARVASHISHVPEYSTAREVARRVRELTTETEPIACLFLDTRIYYFSQRPMTHPIAFVFCRGWDQWYPEFMQAIREKRPKAVLARIPPAFRHERDLERIQPAVYDDVEAKFGPPAKVIRECYRLGEVIDDVCILQPIQPAPG